MQACVSVYWCGTDPSCVWDLDTPDIPKLFLLWSKFGMNKQIECVDTVLHQSKWQFVTHTKRSTLAGTFPLALLFVEENFHTGSRMRGI